MIGNIAVIGTLLKLFKNNNYIVKYEKEIEILDFEEKCESWSELIAINTGNNFTYVVLPMLQYASYSLVNDIYNNNVTSFENANEAIYYAAKILAKPFQGNFNIRAKWFLFFASLGVNFRSLIWKLPFMKNKEWKSNGKVMNIHTESLYTTLFNKIRRNV